MKVIGICGSPKKEGSTTLVALNKAMEEVGNKGLDYEVLELSKYKFSGCDSCGYCRKAGVCSIDDDFTNKIFPVLESKENKGFVFASPVYFGGVTAQMKSFIDRCVVFRRNGFQFENKVAGMLTVGHARNGGQELAAMDLVAFSMIHSMVIVSDASPTSHFGANLHSGCEGGISNDNIGMDTATNIGKKVADITIKLNS